jgi:cardiolipin synthase A/B
MLPPALIASLAAAHGRLPVKTWKSFSDAVSTEAGTLTKASVGRVVSAINNSEVKWDLKEVFTAAIGNTWGEVSLVIQAITHCRTAVGKTMEMVWSGPSSVSLSARRIDQILYDLLTQARHRAFLITFSAHRVARLCRALEGAHKRGVKITLFLETAADSDGQLSSDALNAFTGLPLHQFEILHWPKTQRELNGSGRPGKLHAKCAVIDDAVVISSANLTDDAFNRNMEMGVVAQDPALADSILTHFSALKERKILCRLIQ